MDHTEINRLAGKALKLKPIYDESKLRWTNVARKLYQILKERDEYLLVTDKYSIKRYDAYRMVSVRPIHEQK